MTEINPKGGDGAYLGEQLLRLGEIYRFTSISSEISHDLKIPQHGYGIVLAVCPETHQSAATIEIQILPIPEFQSVWLPVETLLNLIARDEISIKHFPQGSFEQFNQNLARMLRITEEHIELIIDNPELMADWKIHCLYPANTDRVKATYDWLNAQTDWFDIDPQYLDWIFLTRELIAYVNRPNDDGDGSVGRLLPIE